MDRKTRVIIETPYRGDGSVKAIQDNTRYAQDCCHDAISRGEVPFASHLFFPQFLDEMSDNERKLGIESGYEFWPWADLVVFYVDYGMSQGMKEALSRAFLAGKAFEQRRIHDDVKSAAFAIPPISTATIEKKEPGQTLSIDPIPQFLRTK